MQYVTKSITKYKVCCINKTDRHSSYEHITQLGCIKEEDGSRWSFSKDEVIQKIKSKNYEFYVNQAGEKTRVIVD